MRFRWIWYQLGASVQLTPIADGRVGVYGTKLVSGDAASSSCAFRSNGASGPVMYVLATPTRGTAGGLFGDGAVIEFKNGVYLEIIGSPAAVAIAVECGEDVTE